MTQKQENVTAARYLERAGDFIRSAGVVCNVIHVGRLPSTCLLLGYACELLAKRRLLQAGISENALRKKPYGHDIWGMWKETDLFAEAESLVSKLKRKPNAEGVDSDFDFGLHFKQLAFAHSADSHYSLRYHHGEIEFANTRAMTVVLGCIWRVENGECLNWTD